MNMRTSRKTITFHEPFLLESVGRSLPGGAYEVMTDEEPIEGLSFTVYRRKATMMLIPAQSSASSMEMLTIDPQDLAAAIERDVSAAGSASAKAQ